MSTRLPVRLQYQSSFGLDSSLYNCLLSQLLPYNAICCEPTRLVLSRSFGCLEGHHRFVLRDNLQQCRIACLSAVGIIQDVLGYLL